MLSVVVSRVGYCKGRKGWISGKEMGLIGRVGCGSVVLNLLSIDRTSCRTGLMRNRSSISYQTWHVEIPHYHSQTLPQRESWKGNPIAKTRRETLRYERIVAEKQNRRKIGKGKGAHPTHLPGPAWPEAGPGLSPTPLSSSPGSQAASCPACPWPWPPPPSHAAACSPLPFLLAAVDDRRPRIPFPYLAHAMPLSVSPISSTPEAHAGARRRTSVANGDEEPP